MNVPVVPIFNSTNPAPVAGYQNVKPHDAGTAPVDPLVFSVPNTGGVSVKTANYTLVAADCGLLLVYNSSSAGTFTLPSAPPFQQWQVSIANIGTGVLTINRNGLLIDGAATNPTLTQFQGLEVATDNTNYFTNRGFPSTLPAQPLLLVGQFVGKPAASLTFQFPIPSNLSTVAYPASMSGSVGFCDAGAGHPTATVTCTINDVVWSSGAITSTTQIGTMATSTSGVVSFTSTSGIAGTVAAGHQITVVCPATPDATWSGPNFTLAFTR